MGILVRLHRLHFIHKLKAPTVRPNIKHPSTTTKTPTLARTTGPYANAVIAATPRSSSSALSRSGHVPVRAATPTTAVLFNSTPPRPPSHSIDLSRSFNDRLTTSAQLQQVDAHTKEFTKLLSGVLQQRTHASKHSQHFTGHDADSSNHCPESAAALYHQPTAATSPHRRSSSVAATTRSPHLQQLGATDLPPPLPLHYYPIALTSTSATQCIPPGTLPSNRRSKLQTKSDAALCDTSPILCCYPPRTVSSDWVVLPDTPHTHSSNAAADSRHRAGKPHTGSGAESTYLATRLRSMSVSNELFNTSGYTHASSLPPVPPRLLLPSSKSARRQTVTDNVKKLLLPRRARSRHSALLVAHPTDGQQPPTITPGGRDTRRTSAGKVMNTDARSEQYSRITDERVGAATTHGSTHLRGAHPSVHSIGTRSIKDSSSMAYVHLAQYHNRADSVPTKAQPASFSPSSATARRQQPASIKRLTASSSMGSDERLLQGVSVDAVDECKPSQRLPSLAPVATPTPARADSPAFVPVPSPRVLGRQSTQRFSACSSESLSYISAVFRKFSSSNEVTSHTLAATGAAADGPDSSGGHSGDTIVVSGDGINAGVTVPYAGTHTATGSIADNHDIKLQHGWGIAVAAAECSSSGGLGPGKSRLTSRDSLAETDLSWVCSPRNSVEDRFIEECLTYLEYLDSVLDTAAEDLKEEKLWSPHHVLSLIGSRCSAVSKAISLRQFANANQQSSADLPDYRRLAITPAPVYDVLLRSLQSVKARIAHIRATYHADTRLGLLNDLIEFYSLTWMTNSVRLYLAGSTCPVVRDVPAPHLEHFDSSGSKLHQGLLDGIAPATSGSTDKLDTARPPTTTSASRIVPWNEDNLSGLRLSWRVEQNGSISSIVHGKLRCELFRVLAVVSETDYYTRWIPYISNSKLLGNVSKTARLLRLGAEYPWPVGKKEAILFAYGIDALDECGAIIVCGTSPPNTAKQYLGAIVPAETKQVQRVPIHSLVFVLRPQDNGKSTHLEMCMNLESGVNMRLLNPILAWLVKRSVRGIYVRICHYCTNFRGSDWERKVKEDPEFYGWLNRRLMEYYNRPDAHRHHRVSDSLRTLDLNNFKEYIPND